MFDTKLVPGILLFLSPVESGYIRKVYPVHHPTESVGKGRDKPSIYLQSLGNPKAILIFTAFLPQFVSVSSATPVTEQFAVLGGLFLLLEWLAIAIYAWLGAYLQRWFNQPGPRRLFNRVSASLLACAGVGLLAARRA